MKRGKCRKLEPRSLFEPDEKCLFEPEMSMEIEKKDVETLWLLKIFISFKNID